MPVAYLRSIALLFCAFLFSVSLGFAQQEPKRSDLFGSNHFVGDPIQFGTVSQSPSAEPWKILPDQPQAVDSTRLLSSHVDQFKADFYQMDRNGKIFLPYSVMTDQPPAGEHMHDSVCYSIRSYVVARDNKDSDTTHFVRSSTCQPARQYGLKSTVMKSSVQGK